MKCKGERLRRAELAEAEARARDAESDKGPRVPVALAARVLLAMTLGGGGVLWVKADRDARHTRVALDVIESLNMALALRERAKAAPAVGAVLFAQAREQAQRATALVEAGPADAALADQARRLQSEL